MTFQTVGAPEVRACRPGKGFIRAEVMRFTGLDWMGAPARVREAGRLKSAGRDYPAAGGGIL